MKFSQLFCPTLKEVPHEAEVVSHQLMLRAGMIRQLASGIYNYLPLGLKVIRKIESIVREEMNRAGALELLMPAVIPSELWKETGRWDGHGKELLRLKDRKGKEYCIGPTHEEVITDLARKELRSYKDLPKNFYQIQTKFRDEVRPRFGLMRGREFIMKDAYSFDASHELCEKSYELMFDAYCRIFERCGLEYRAVNADSGNIGGSLSQEFMVLAKSGEDQIVLCSSCQYAANMEKAICKVNPKETIEMTSEVSEVATGKAKTIDEVAQLLSLNPNKLIKTLLYTYQKNEKQHDLLVLTTGDRDVNEILLARELDASELRMASEEDILRVFGAPAGCLGPVRDFSQEIYVDLHVSLHQGYVVGANKVGFHSVNVVLSKAFSNQKQIRHTLISKVKEGDACVECGAELKIERGIEVGHVFKLGTKYSEAMNAQVIGPDGKPSLCVMGCYGIGISRISAAAIEQNHDEWGMVFPRAIAPFEISVIATDTKDDLIRSEAEKIYQALLSKGIDVLLDDRAIGAGAKFKDTDLLGIPLKVTVGKQFLQSGNLEVKSRREKESKLMTSEQFLQNFEELFNVSSSS